MTPRLTMMLTAVQPRQMPWPTVMQLRETLWLTVMLTVMQLREMLWLRQMPWLTVVQLWQMPGPWVNLFCLGIGSVEHAGSTTSKNGAVATPLGAERPLLELRQAPWLTVGWLTVKPRPRT